MAYKKAVFAIGVLIIITMANINSSAASSGSGINGITLPPSIYIPPSCSFAPQGCSSANNTASNSPTTTNSNSTNSGNNTNSSGAGNPVSNINSTTTGNNNINANTGQQTNINTITPTGITTSASNNSNNPVPTPIATTVAPILPPQTANCPIGFLGLVNQLGNGNPALGLQALSQLFNAFSELIALTEVNSPQRTALIRQLAGLFYTTNNSAQLMTAAQNFSNASSYDSAIALAFVDISHKSAALDMIDIATSHNNINNEKITQLLHSIDKELGKTTDYKTRHGLNLVKQLVRKGFFGKIARGIFGIRSNQHSTAKDALYDRALTLQRSVSADIDISASMNCNGNNSGAVQASNILQNINGNGISGNNSNISQLLIANNNNANNITGQQTGQVGSIPQLNLPKAANLMALVRKMGSGNIGAGIDKLSNILSAYASLINDSNQGASGEQLFSNKVTSVLSGIEDPNLLIMQARAMKNASLADKQRLVSMMRFAKDRQDIRNLIVTALNSNGKSQFQAMQQRILLQMRDAYNSAPDDSKYRTLTVLNKLGQVNVLGEIMDGVVSPYKNKSNNANQVYDAIIRQQQAFQAKTGFGVIGKANW